MAARTAKERFDIDPIHNEIDVYAEDNQLTMDVWRSKYRYLDEPHPHDSMRRVVEGVYAKDKNKEAKKDALAAMRQGLWIPAGRIQAGAGTPNVVTLLNCYMCQDIEDSMVGIADALKDAMLTMQQGGGIGMNFSTLRPSGAFLRRTGAVASGPLPFMDMWNSMCATIMSAGSRRGAMMAVMSIDHPDLPKFITAKQEKGRLTNFNVSVLVTDAFMAAVEEDEDWYLGFTIPRADGKHLFVAERDEDEQFDRWYAYSRWRARDLWDLILENTYEWSEPGVIFIDRVNRRNNLRYCETITGTNPCGEQPLPPDGCCNLGAVNLAKMVIDPFTPKARFNFDLLSEIAGIGTRFLDNVIDVTLYPLESQAKEEFAKRRIGVGITGLANCLQQLGLRYGSPDAIKITNLIMDELKNAVYFQSALLAAERKPFPLYNPEAWGAGANLRLASATNKEILKSGSRNGVLLTVAPTGTTSLYAGNVSSGLEPVFMHKMTRNVRQDDDSLKPYTAYDYGYLLYCMKHRVNPERVRDLPDYMVTHEDLSIDDHIVMQAIVQEHVDASVSKTINVPKEMSINKFKGLYTTAYNMGLKGCTTYRPSDVRGSILMKADDSEPIDGEAPLPLTRPEVLSGQTYKVKWPNVDDNYYITINEVNGRPFEVFIQSTSSRYADWTTALALMVSAIMRKGGDISFIPRELQKVRSADDSAYIEGHFYGSLVALIGATIGKHIAPEDEPFITELDPSADEIEGERIRISLHTSSPQYGETCPMCNQPTLFRQEGCKTCKNCGYSNCA